MILMLLFQHTMTRTDEKKAELQEAYVRALAARKKFDQLAPGRYMPYHFCIYIFSATDIYSHSMLHAPFKNSAALASTCALICIAEAACSVAYFAETLHLICCHYIFCVCLCWRSGLRSPTQLCLPTWWRSMKAQNSPSRYSTLICCMLWFTIDS